MELYVSLNQISSYLYTRLRQKKIILSYFPYSLQGLF